jgi:glucose/mannose-6-phosphate isomerase
LAKKIYSTIPIVVTEESLTSISFRLKSQLNENSKMLSYNITLPEMNHNEIVGWQGKEIDKNALSLVWIDIRYNKNIKRMNITNNILKNRVASNNHIDVPSEIASHRLASCLYLVNYVDWLSYWCAILHGTDPSPVKKISRLKEELSKRP